jgi:hypothetical protein
VPRLAFAAANDAAAAKLREAAIYQDYLATDFASAEKKLAQALALCEKPADCTAATRARLHCDLGSVYFAEQKSDEANAQFAAAVKEDPTVAIDPDLTTPDLQKAFAAATKGAAKPAAGTTPPNAGTPTGEKPAPATGEEEETEENTETAPKAPVKAETASDCPPGFPGCKSAATCSADDDCGAGEKCVDSKCSSSAETTVPGKSNWIGLAVQGDLLFLPQASNVCRGGQGYSCFNSDGSWYQLTPTANANDSVDGGAALATIRLFLTYDRRFGNFTAGAGAGVAFRGGPHRPGANAFLPFHGEIRGKYWFGHDPFGRAGFRANVMLGLGIAEVDSSIPNVSVQDSMGIGAKTAWRKTGTGFGAVGVGIGGAFTPNTMLMFEPRFMQMFPTSGEVLGFQISFAYGL